MTELKMKFTKGVVKRAAAVAMAVCLGATLIPPSFAKAAENQAAAKQGVGYADLTGTGLKVDKQEIKIGETATATLTVTAKAAETKEVSGNIVSGNTDTSGNVELTPVWSSSDGVDVVGGTEKVTVGAESKTTTVKATVKAKSAGKAQIKVKLGQKDYDATIEVKAADTKEPGSDDGSGSGNGNSSDGSGSGTTEPTPTPTPTPEPTETVKEVSKVAITLNGQTVKGTLKAKVGKSYSFKAAVTPSDAKDKKVTWSTSNKKVATVSSSGKVKVKKAGKATITVKSSNGKTAKVTLNASKKTVKVSKVAIKGNKSMKVKKSQTLKATVTPATADNTKVTWKTSNKKIATVNSKGKVTAKKKGTVKITATAKDGSKKKATFKIKVKSK